MSQDREKFSRVVEIIPTYDERDNIAILVPTIFEKTPGSAILVVDDNSLDGTAGVVTEMSRSFPKLFLLRRLAKRGFGRSYLDGFRQILNDPEFDVVVMMDADFSHDPAEVEAMVEKLSAADVVVGSRYIPGGGIKNWSWRRRLLSRFANWYVRQILGLPVRDTTTGFMCLKKSALAVLNLNSLYSDGYAFLVELKYRLWRAGFKIQEHPIIFDERREGQSKMSTKVIWEAIWLPWKLRSHRNFDR